MLIDEYFLINNTFHRIRKDIKDYNERHEYTKDELKEAMDRFNEVFVHNVWNGKRYRVLMAVNAIQMIAQKQKREVSKEELEEVCILGWVVEIMLGSFIITDDVMDNSITRRNHKCWFRKVFYF